MLCLDACLCAKCASLACLMSKEVVRWPGSGITVVKSLLANARSQIQVLGDNTLSHQAFSPGLYDLSFCRAILFLICTLLISILYFHLLSSVFVDSIWLFASPLAKRWGSFLAPSLCPSSNLTIPFPHGLLPTPLPHQPSNSLKRSYLFSLPRVIHSCVS